MSLWSKIIFIATDLNFKKIAFYLNFLLNKMVYQSCWITNALLINTRHKLYLPVCKPITACIVNYTKLQCNVHVLKQSQFFYSYKKKFVLSIAQFLQFVIITLKNIVRIFLNIKLIVKIRKKLSLFITDF